MIDDKKQAALLIEDNMVLISILLEHASFESGWTEIHGIGI